MNTEQLRALYASLEGPIDRNPIVYLAGPMRDIKAFNFPAFDLAALKLRAQRFTVISPAEIDQQAYPNIDWYQCTGTTNPQPFDIRKAFVGDVRAIGEADAVIVLPGYLVSRGAMAEIAVAVALDKPVFEFETGERIIILQPQRIPDGETIVTDADTGGQKGQKLERFDLIPAEPLAALARIYGYGAKKYDPHNWRKGYAWGLSFAALMRHLWAFWRGQNDDPESQQPHLAHAAWHCFTLLWFFQFKAEKDDRPKIVSNPESK